MFAQLRSLRSALFFWFSTFSSELLQRKNVKKPCPNGTTYVYISFVVSYFLMLDYLFKFKVVVDNDTTVHGVHTDTVAFSLLVLIKCSIRH